MVFDFFGFKKKPVIEDVEPKVPTPASMPATMTFEEALAAQEAKEAAKEQTAPQATEPKGLAPVAVVPETAQVPIVGDVALAKAPEELNQIDIVRATPGDVIAAYKVFLRRKPENQTVVDSRLGLPREKIFLNFITSKEFLKYPENINLILQTAREIEMKYGTKAQEGGL